ncbi:DEAD/DEAH box helicase family protein [Sulfurimonas sp. ST-25]|uniref:type I restriction endonuclease subunit R n=1 Tax=Sulfurimonas sp. ST-25 TaxID=3400151 RepID=UPI003A8BF163
MYDSLLNQNPEQIARDKIDAMLRSSGWAVQNKDAIDHKAAEGIAVREYQTDIGPADYVLFVDRKPVGVIEAKKETEGHRISVVEEQSQGYAEAKLKWCSENTFLPFIYESTGTLTRFRDERDPKPRSREVFSFHRPETLREWLGQSESLRTRLEHFPGLSTEGLRDCQISAVTNLETSFGENRPRALIQMATGAGKTFTAITSIYRLLKHARGKRILFLVDTRNLGEQAEKEFMAYTPQDDNRQFTELYNVQRLSSSYVATDSQVCISTIQRMYSILRGNKLDESAEDISGFEHQNGERPREVAYNPAIPIEFFDFIIVDECHRSIYNVWQQVLDYFDAFLIGLTATPDKRTFGFFHENIVSQYTHDNAVADGVNVPYEEYIITTAITKEGAKLDKESKSGDGVIIKQVVEHRDKLTRKKKWRELDDDVEYRQSQLDKKVVNPSQIRNIVKEFKAKLPVLFPDRKEVPKTLIFAKSDSHADDIISIVREEFGERNEFCKKVTYQAKNPKEILQSLRNDYYPRIAVTVDMIATGTDVKPLECLIFMRDVRSRNYFEQMKGRGTRICSMDMMKKAGTNIEHDKTHFVIVDAVGVTESVKTDSQPLERKKSVPMKDLMMEVLMGGADDEDTYRSIAARLARLNKEMTAKEREEFTRIADRKIEDVTHIFLDAHDADKQVERAQLMFGIVDDEMVTPEQLDKAQEAMVDEARSVLTGELVNYADEVRRKREQIIDTVNIDSVVFSGWKTESEEGAKNIIESFESFLEKNKDEITVLRIFYNEPYRRREVTYRMLKELVEKLKEERPPLAPLKVWEAYERLSAANGSPKSELGALVGLVRYVSGIDDTLTPLQKRVALNFQDWVLKKHAGNAPKFSEVQMDWLRRIRDEIARSYRFETDDFELMEQGALGKVYKLFGDELAPLLDEMNEALVS